MAHPQVAEAVVVGRTNDRLGEEVVAVVRLTKGSNTDPTDEILTWAARHLARYKQPRDLIIIPEFPTNATGKILKREVAAMFRSNDSRCETYSPTEVP